MKVITFMWIDESHIFTRPFDLLFDTEDNKTPLVESNDNDYASANIPTLALFEQFLRDVEINEKVMK